MPTVLANIVGMTKTAAPTATCTRCGRTLTSAKSIADRMGRTCRAKVRAAAKAAALAQFAAKPHLVAKAEELIEAGGIVAIRPGVYRTAGSEGAIYLTTAAGCNCKAGLRAKHVCHHRIAATAMDATFAALIVPTPAQRTFALAA